VSGIENLREIIENIREELDALDEARDEAQVILRDLHKLSSEAVYEVHRGNLEEAREKLDEAAELVSELHDLLGDFPELLRTGFAENHLQEYAEAEILYSIVKDRKAPSLEEINVSPRAYLLGLLDAVGELRRIVVDALREGDLDRAEEFLNVMEEIYSLTMTFDYPRAVVPNLKRKQDVARSLLERTRSEVTIAGKTEELKRALERE
jgi:translin